MIDTPSELITIRLLLTKEEMQEIYDIGRECQRMLDKIADRAESTTSPKLPWWKKWRKL